jgi:hypothetical protein
MLVHGEVDQGHDHFAAIPCDLLAAAARDGDVVVAARGRVGFSY